MMTEGREKKTSTLFDGLLRKVLLQPRHTTTLDIFNIPLKTRSP